LQVLEVCQAENHVPIQFFIHKKEACSSGPHHQTYLRKIWISWLQTEKKIPWHLSAKYSIQTQRQQFFYWQWLTDRFSLKGCCCFCFGWGLINFPKVLMWSACSESHSFYLSYNTVTVPRFTTTVYRLFSLGEIVCWFSQTVSIAIVLHSAT